MVVKKNRFCPAPAPRPHFYFFLLTSSIQGKNLFHNISITTYQICPRPRPRPRPLTYLMSCDSPIIVSLNDLKTDEGYPGLKDEILEKAFGPNSLGIIIIKDLPIQFVELRKKVLISASKLANLPTDQLKSLECEKNYWLTGWSCGKEKLRQTNNNNNNNNYSIPDDKKGSFYINCSFYKDDKLESPPQELVDKFPNHLTYTMKNIWPPEDENSGLIGFKQNLKNLCNLIISISESVAINCDKYIKSHYPNDYPSNDYLTKIVQNSTCTKARLLHYFPNYNYNYNYNNKEEEKEEEDNNNLTDLEAEALSDDNWCGEHLDHSCLTGLTSALYIDESKGLNPHHAAAAAAVVLDNSSPDLDPDSGLYIKNRQNDKIIKINIPHDCLAFQSGSTLQQVSKNKFKAVPHFVKSGNNNKGKSIARNTLAVFIQPNLDEMVNEMENFAQYSDRILKSNH